MVKAEATSPVFFDTSVLVAGLIEIGAASAPAHRTMTAIAKGRVRGPLTAWHCCLEFYSVSTRLPAELRLTPMDALRLIEEEVLGRFRICQLPESSQRSFLQSAAREPVIGGRIYDAHIAEIALSAKARTVVTDNRRHFTGLLRHGLRVLTTAEFAALLERR